MRSMTGYGRASVEHEGARLTVELRSINSRFLDLELRLGEGLLGSLDLFLRQKLSQSLSRGKLRVNVEWRELEQGADRAQVNIPLALSYQQAILELAQEIGEPVLPRVKDLVSLPGVLVREKEMTQGFEQTAEAERAALETRQKAMLEEALDLALDSLQEQRLNEGRRLKDDILLRLDLIGLQRERILERIEEEPELIYQKMRQRLSDLLSDQDLTLNEDRLLQELAFLADRKDLTEELVRLESHIQEMVDLMDREESVGKKLDFLCQEMAREANTMGSKCQDLTVLRAVLDIKAEVEKIREQVQNIE